MAHAQRISIFLGLYWVRESAMEKQIEMFPGSPRGGCSYSRRELDPARVPRAVYWFISWPVANLVIRYSSFVYFESRHITS